MKYMKVFREYVPTNTELQNKTCNAFLKCIKADIEQCMKSEIDLHPEFPDKLIETLTKLHSQLSELY